MLGLGIVVVVGEDEQGGGLEAVGGAGFVHLGDVGENIVESCLDEVVWLHRGAPEMHEFGCV